MSNINFPKHTADLDEIIPALKLYYEAGTWQSNKDHIEQLKLLIGANRDPASYMKKSQNLYYFGFVEWNPGQESERRITTRGKKFYEHFISQNEELICEDLMIALERMTFGRDNKGAYSSDTDVEAPNLLIRAILDLGYITPTEFAFSIWNMVHKNCCYAEVKQAIRTARNSGELSIPDDRKFREYKDPKFHLFMTRLGFLADANIDGVRKATTIAPNVLEKYRNRLYNLRIYNVDRDEHKEGEGKNKGGDDVLMVENSAQKKDYAVNELGSILAEMYANANSKTTAIHMFAIKYGEAIKRAGYTANALVTAAHLNDSYTTEVSKGVRIYESMCANEYGVKFYDGEGMETRAIDKLPACSPRVRKTYPLNCILYGAPGTGKTYATAAYALAVAENKELKEVERESRDLIMQRYNQLVENGRVTFTTFHQSYGYEDFIQGMRPDTAGAGNGLSFKTVDGVFKGIADRAFQDPSNDYVIIIDEINRANISKVFGELITLIEDDKRWGELNAVSVTLPSGDTFAVPNNLYIVGTMNSADKSISLIDTALRRRFVFVEHKPKLELIQDDTLRKVLEVLNKGISEELRSTDLLIGHSYFLNKTVSDLEDIMNRSIIPLLYEYFFDDRKKVLAHVNKAIEGLDLEVDTNPFGRVSVKKGAE